MHSPLSIEDPLSNQAVTIIITLPPSEQPREERPCLVSVGQPEKLPLSRSGPFADIAALINTAWTALGVREATAVRTEPAVLPPNEPADPEEEALASMPTTDAALPPAPSVPTTWPNTSVTPPKIQNLSLF